MASQVVTELVIDSAGATRGAEEFTRAMDGAQAAARKSTGVITDLTLAIAGVGVGAIAAMASIRAFVDSIGGVNKQFVDVSNGAKSAGLSIRELQQTLFAGRTGGVSEKDFFGGIEKIGTALTDANRGVTEFGKLFAVNGLSIKDANGNLKTTKDAIGDIANLMRNAPTPAVEQGIARIAGLTKEWVPFLRQGTAEIERVKQQAQEAGVIVDDGVVKAAIEFDKEWKKATAAWDLQMRSSLASILPLLQQLAQLAIFVLNATGKVAEFFSNAATPIEGLGDGALKQRLADVEALREQMRQLEEVRGSSGNATFDAAKAAHAAAAESGSEIEKVKAGLGAVKNILSDVDELRVRGKKSLLLGDDRADLAAADAMVVKLRELIQLREKAGNGTPLRVTGGGTQLPAGSAEKSDALDRAIMQSEKHTAAVLAEAKAVGLGAGALAEYRTIAALTTAANQTGTQITDELAAKFRKLGQEARNAAIELERSKVNSQIDFQRQTAFLSPEDLQIAQQLRGLYGNDVPAALASSEAAAMRFNNMLKSINDTIRGAAESFAKDFVGGLMSGKSVMESLGQAARNLSSSLTNSAITSLFSGNFVMAGIQGVGALVSGLFGRSQQRREEEQKAIQQAIARQQEYTYRASAAGLDTSTREGALAQMEQQFQRERAQEAQAGGMAMVTLLNAQNLEMLALQREWDKRELEQEKAKREEVLKRQESFQDRLFAATNDNSTLEGALAEFERNALKARMEELRAGGEAVNDLEAALAAERLNIIQRFNEEARKAGEELLKFVQGIAKKVREYLDSLKVGPQSILDPQGQLNAAQTQFDRQLALALSGDRDALGSITQYASALLEQARSFFASGEGYTNIYKAVTAGLEGVANLSPTTVSDNDAVVAAIQQTTQAVNTTGANADQLASLQNTTLAGLAQLNNTLNDISDRQGRQDASIGNTLIEQMNKLLGIQNLAVMQLAAIAKNGATSSGSFSFGAVFQFQRGGRVPGYQDGGLITNGDWNRDSVMAMTPRGPAMFAGGEFIMPAPQTQQFLPQLEAMRSGRGANDNGRLFEGLAAIARTNANGFSVLADRLDRVERAIMTGSKMTSETYSQERRRPERPGRAA